MMTLDEKINALSTDLGVPRLGVRSAGHSEGLHGLALGGPGVWGGRAIENYKIVAKEYPTTTFPQAYGLGATWDTAMIRKVADIEAEEVRFYAQNYRYNKRGLVMRAPNADLARDPRWGRTEESFGEDPFLTARLTVAFVKGLQGEDPNYWKSASLMKHFLANSNEDGRDSTSSNFDDRLFYEYYGYPFYKGITEGGSQAFMAAYNSWNGTPMTVHPVLDKIRKQWDMEGIICTDGGALGLLITAHKAYKDHTEGAAAVIKAGVGQFLDNYRSYTYEALERGILNEKDIDKVLYNNYVVGIKLGLLDADVYSNPYHQIGVEQSVEPWTKPEVKKFVREVTAKSAVLLKNSKNLLPIDKKKIKSIAVIGPRANEVQLDWYSGTPPYEVTILDGIKNAVGNDVEILYEPSNSIDKAAIAASKADVAIVCIGNHVYGTRADWKYAPVQSDGREAVDRRALTLEQEELAKIVYAANPNTVLVLVSCFPFAINWSQENIPAILNISNNSQELGNGVADVLFGDVNPAGRTTQTWVSSITDLPPMMDYDITNGRTYMYSKVKPLYEFGYGLSYTKFDYSNMQLSNASVDKKGEVTVSVDVKNSGARDGEEVVQLYVSYPESKISRPNKQLRSFARVAIKSGETKKVELKLKAEDLAYWNTNAEKFEVESGKINVMVGSSSANIRQTKKLNVK